MPTTPTASDRPPRPIDDIAASHPEIEFALVLARTLDSLSSDPERLRSAIYELARHKMQQISDGDQADKAQLMQALETAIAGVEAHARKYGPASLPSPMTRRMEAPDPGGAVAIPRAIEPPADHTWRERKLADAWSGVGVRRGGRPRWTPSMPIRFAAVLLFVVCGTVGGIVLKRRDVASSAQRPVTPAATPVAPVVTSPQVASTAAFSPRPVRDPSLPTAYGVYAQSAGHLNELQMLQGRVPDPRVAISAAITRPSETTVPDGHIRFVVFQRDTPPDAFDAVEVRVVAKVKQATSFDAAGKPVVSSNEDTWVIRNIAIPCRASPLNDEPQMYEIKPRDPDLEFAPGRYALVIKGHGFDFSVAGKMTDKKQCLERLVAANGTFYSECQKP